MTEAALFRRCRKALGLSTEEMARTTANRWRPQHPAPGGRTPPGIRPRRMALEGMLRDEGETALADRVFEVIERRRR
jgi:hypothetical protein